MAKGEKIGIGVQLLYALPCCDQVFDHLKFEFAIKNNATDRFD